MFIELNLDVVREIQRADFLGKSRDEMKPLYIEQNMFGVDADKRIHRILQLRHLVSDIQGNKLTHIKACPLIWNSPLENPLLTHTYKGENGETFSLAGIVDDFYAVCWTARRKSQSMARILAR